MFSVVDGAPECLKGGQFLYCSEKCLKKYHSLLATSEFGGQAGAILIPLFANYQDNTLVTNFLVEHVIKGSNRFTPWLPKDTNHGGTKVDGSMDVMINGILVTITFEPDEKCHEKVGGLPVSTTVLYWNDKGIYHMHCQLVKMIACQKALDRPVITLRPSTLN